MENAASMRESLDPASRGIIVRGRVPHPVRFAMEDLRAMEGEEFRDLFLVCGTGEPRSTIESCRGVLIEKVIQQANVDKGEHNDTKRMYIVATAADGYQVVFSWQEIFNTPGGGGVALLLEKDGQPLDDSGDRIDLVSAGDYFAGSRYVRDLRFIEVLRHD